jgi:hypothetical protein
MKTENKKPAFDEREMLYYHFDGKEWCLKWEEKFEVSDLVHANISQELEKIRQQVHDGKLSPLAYHIYHNFYGSAFDISVLASYIGIPKRHIKKHLNPENFNRLGEDTLKKYAEIFDISIEELINV